MNKTVITVAISCCFGLVAALAHADTDTEKGAAERPGSAEEMIFKAMDSNADGAISKAEFDAFHAKRFKELDVNGDGKVTRDEMMAERKKVVAKSKKSLKESFSEADTNHDGALTREEAKKMPVLAGHFDTLDANKDGKLTREELNVAMENMRRKNDAKK